MEKTKITQHAGCPKGAMIENLEVQCPMNDQEKAVSNRKALSSRGTLGTLDPSQHSLKLQAIKQRVRKTLLNVQGANCR